VVNAPVIAITREVSPSLRSCQLTHLPRVPIDAVVARAQHAEYERCLAAPDCVVRSLPAQPDLPDSVFIEDTAVVLDRLAIMTRPGSESRRPEVPSIAEALKPLRSLSFITTPATLDGGDVLVAGTDVFVGLSTRTNAEAIAQLRALLNPHGYTVKAVEVRGCLHLKSAAPPSRTVLCWSTPRGSPPRLC
jgi:dimethylargininase